MTIHPELEERVKYYKEVLRLPRQEALLGVAAEIAEDVLSKKPRVRIAGNKSPTREQIIEVAAADFEKRLRETGIWEELGEADRAERIDWFRRAQRFAMAKPLPPSLDGPDSDGWLRALIRRAEQRDSDSWYFDEILRTSAKHCEKQGATLSEELAAYIQRNPKPFTRPPGRQSTTAERNFRMTAEFIDRHHIKKESFNHAIKAIADKYYLSFGAARDIVSPSRGRPGYAWLLPFLPDPADEQ